LAASSSIGDDGDDYISKANSPELLCQIHVCTIQPVCAMKTPFLALQVAASWIGRIFAVAALGSLAVAPPTQMLMCLCQLASEAGKIAASCWGVVPYGM
jgi:hypothetical protein